MTAGRCSRTVRAAVFAAVCVLLAALGHVMMSGSHAPAWVLSAGLAVTGAAGWCLTGRERGPALIVAVVVGAQTLLHSAFSVAQSATVWSVPMSSTHMGGTEGMDSGAMGHMGTSHMDHMGDMAHSTGGGTSSSGMLAAHLLAALLCGLWLAYGERAAFRILRAVGGWLAAPLRLLLALPAPPHPPRLRVRASSSDRAPRLLLLVHAITHRGPPLGTAVV
ncbi:hypothetical protein ABT063_34510 [Streptomyces sp. NPDC002838]|uniref:hypothetical protein n=1 Tax=Streptomyces sp. NPDC002838 TaxID=3154436 RepID=UPI003316D094